VLVGGAAFCAIVAVAGGGPRRRWWGWLAGACVGGLALVGILAVASPGRFGDLGKVLGYLTAQDPLSGSTLEARNLSDLGLQALSWAFTDLWVLAPVAFVYLIWQHRRRGFAESELTFLILWCVISVVLAGSLFFRYRAHLALPLAIGVGIGLSDAYRWGSRALWQTGGRLRRGATFGAVDLTVLVPALLLKDTVQALQLTTVQNAAREFPLARHAFEWLRRATPDPGGRLDAQERPKYGVLAPWRYGFWLNYIAERPNIASPNILLPVEVKGARASLEVLLAEAEDQAARESRHLRARYILATNLNPYLGSFSSLLGRPLENLMELVQVDGETVFRFTDRYFQIINNRMLLFDGSQAPSFGIPALEQFRLVYESPYRFQWTGIPQERPVLLPDAEISGFKIFERVSGAMISGKTRPLTKVLAEITVRTNQGREFLYQTATRSDAQGVFSLRVPYSTRASPEPERTVALGAYRVSVEGGKIEVPVTEEEVLQGARLGAEDVRRISPQKLGIDFDKKKGTL
jgi:dolichyl-diphosphooligosaccharide--protein glycosyltransferase